MNTAAYALPGPTSPSHHSPGGTVGVRAATEAATSGAAPAPPRPAARSAPPAPREATGLVAGRIALSALHGPGHRHVVFLQGCQFDCLTCSSPQLMPQHPRGSSARTVQDTMEEIVQDAPYLTGVTISGGEPTEQPEFVLALLTALAEDRRTARLTRFVATNADAPADVWAMLAPVTDGFLVDLKALDDGQHVVLTGHSNRRILTSIRDLVARRLLYEVQLLLVPGVNDADADLRRTAAWLLAVDPKIRVRVVEFGKRGTRACARDLLEPQRPDFVRYWHELSAAGIEDLVVP